MVFCAFTLVRRWSRGTFGTLISVHTVEDRGPIIIMGIKHFLKGKVFFETVSGFKIYGKPM